jgi:hypothetical protein
MYHFECNFPDYHLSFQKGFTVQKLKQEGHEVRRTLWGNFETMGEHENYG